MIRAIFLSILLHIFAVASIYFLLKTQSYSTPNSVKQISINSITIEKSKKLQAKSEKPKAQSIKLKAESEKLEVGSWKLEAQSKKRKAKSHKRAESLELRAKSRFGKKKAKSKKLKAKSRKHKVQSSKYKAQSHKRAESLELRAKSRLGKLNAQSSKRKVKRKKIKAHQLPITNSQLQITNYQSQIYQAINRAKVYPRLAKRMGLEGRVYTCFTLNPNRVVTNITTQGSHSLLQKGAKQTINRAKQNFPKVPYPINLCINIKYLLE